MKLDLYDKKILAQLDVNARISATSIAKKIRLPKETVNYRIRRLLKSDYVTRVYTLFNCSLLGYDFYKIYLKLKNNDPKMEENIINFVKNQPLFANIRVIQGSYDIVFITLQKSSLELRQFMQQFYNEFGDCIAEKEIHKMIRTHKMNPKYLLETQPFRIAFNLSEPKEQNLDSTDVAIIQLLSEDARIKLIDIAQKIKIDPRIVRYRIKKLEKQGIIVGYTLEMNFERIQQQQIELNFSLKNLDVIPSIIEFFDRAKVCLFAHELIGKYDLSLELYLPNNFMLRELLQRFKQLFLESYVYYEVSNVYKEHTINWSPFNNHKNSKAKKDEKNSSKNKYDPLGDETQRLTVET